MKLKRVAILGLTLASMGHGFQAPAPKIGFAPKGDVTVWPLQIINCYPFVRGTVGNTAGVFMLDTGWGDSLGLNRERVELTETKAAGEMVAGSGQRMANVVADRIDPLRIGEETWEGLHSVQGSALGFVEKGIGTPPFLGFIGMGFFENCEMALDYDRQVAVFRKLGTKSPANPSPEGQPWGKPLATLRYTTRPGLDNVPLFGAKLGGRPVRLTIDTGTNVAILPEALFREFEAEKRTSEFRNVGGQRTFQVNELEVGGLSFPLQWAIGRANVSSAPVGPGAPLVLVGYPLFQQFRTVWNFRDKTVALYPPAKFLFRSRKD